MFETAELGQKISKEEYKAQAPVLRLKLLEAQARLLEADFPVVVLFAGVDGAGKGDTANLLSAWMDPHWIVTRAFEAPSEEERERPAYWRYWRDLPPKGHIGLFLSAWYSPPLLRHVYGETSADEFEEALERIRHFERTLADDGALILKFWMHLGKQAQKKRFKALEADPLQRWRVTEQDWEHWRMYERFVGAAERIVMRTSTGAAPWTIVEGADQRFRSLRVGTVLLEGIERHLLVQARQKAGREAVPAPHAATEGHEDVQPWLPGTSILSTLDLTKKLGKAAYAKRKGELQARLGALHREARAQGVSLVLVFEGWDAAGKGGAIRRTMAALDARSYEVIQVQAPTDEERAQHYLWRFWRHLPRAGRVLVFDRSWYGRVLVERVEGFATEREWRRAYAEINDFESQLVEDGIVLVKFWIHITPDEQAARFKAREDVPHKRWKMTEEDWRNRERWPDYEVAVNDMVERTSTQIAPWILVEGNDKRHARVRVLEAVCEHLEQGLKRARKKGKGD